MLLLPPPHVLPDVLHLLLGDRLQQVVLCALPDALKHGLRVLIGRHHCGRPSSGGASPAAWVRCQACQAGAH